MSDVYDGSEQCCPACGAQLRDARTCRQRLDVLLVKKFESDAAEYALAVSAFVLQHPDGFDEVDVASAHLHLRLTLEDGLDLAEVRKRLRRRFGKEGVDAPSKPAVPARWRYTIDELEDEDGDEGMRIVAWSRSVLKDLREATPQ
jgi:hypothetical protein